MRLPCVAWPTRPEVASSGFAVRSKWEPSVPTRRRLFQLWLWPSPAFWAVLPERLPSVVLDRVPWRELLQRSAELLPRTRSEAGRYDDGLGMRRRMRRP
jgi:hypothetical protein